jgi:hypothetical protein
VRAEREGGRKKERREGGKRREGGGGKKEGREGSRQREKQKGKPTAMSVWQKSVLISEQPPSTGNKILAVFSALGLCLPCGKLTFSSTTLSSRNDLLILSTATEILSFCLTPLRFYIPSKAPTDYLKWILYYLTLNVVSIKYLMCKTVSHLRAQVVPHISFI